MNLTGNSSSLSVNCENKMLKSQAVILSWSLSMNGGIKRQTLKKCVHVFVIVPLNIAKLYMDTFLKWATEYNHNLVLWVWLVIPVKRVEFILLNNSLILFEIDFTFALTLNYPPLSKKEGPSPNYCYFGGNYYDFFEARFYKSNHHFYSHMDGLKDTFISMYLKLNIPSTLLPSI